MSSIKSLIGSFSLMIICLIIAYVFGFILTSAELIHIELAKAGVNDVLPEWQNYDDSVFYMKLEYFIGYFIAFFGIGQFLWTATRKEAVVYYAE